MRERQREREKERKREREKERKREIIENTCACWCTHTSIQVTIFKTHGHTQVFTNKHSRARKHARPHTDMLREIHTLASRGFE